MLHSILLYLYSNLPLPSVVRSYLERFVYPDDQLMNYGPAGGNWGSHDFIDENDFDDISSEDYHHFTDENACYSGTCDCLDI